jgi:hypothetical protein
MKGEFIGGTRILKPHSPQSQAPHRPASQGELMAYGLKWTSYRKALALARAVLGTPKANPVDCIKALGLEWRHFHQHQQLLMLSRWRWEMLHPESVPQTRTPAALNMPAMPHKTRAKHNQGQSGAITQPHASRPADGAPDQPEMAGPSHRR